MVRRRGLAAACGLAVLVSTAVGCDDGGSTAAPKRDPRASAPEPSELVGRWQSEIWTWQGEPSVQPLRLELGPSSTLASASCNVTTGSYVVRYGALVATGLAETLGGCAEPGGPLWSLLEAVPVVRLEDGRLVLDGGDHHVELVPA